MTEAELYGQVSRYSVHAVQPLARSPDAFKLRRKYHTSQMVKNRSSRTSLRYAITVIEAFEMREYEKIEE